MRIVLDMKIKNVRAPIIALAALVALGRFAPNAFAGPTVAPGRKLYLIKTEHFDIIFPAASRPSALRLSTMADSVYDEVSGKLEAKVPGRIPVIISPDEGSFNGGTYPFPYMHIILYDTSLDIGWTAFRDNLRGLFLHEVTHAISLRIRAPWASFFAGIFGSWVSPGMLNAPEFMVEGVAVSFESADGVTGRASDPLYKERVHQDILENFFKSPLEASALYDEYPGDTYYEYGGLFNAYIQKTYGMEKYAQLWKAMGNLVFSFSLDPYEWGFYTAFHRVYGIPFVKAWADFRTSLDISGVAEAPEILWPLGRESRASMGDSVVSDGKSLYWVDSRSNKAMAMEADTLNSRALFDADSYCLISDAKSDGTNEQILVSRTIFLPDGRDRTETLAYDLASKRFVTNRKVPDMREARFFRSGWVGIVSKLHNTDLVYASESGSRVLLSGSESVMYSSPAVLDDKRVALIVAVDGKRSIGILDLDSGKLGLVKSEGDEQGLFTYVRQISAADGILYFNYDSDDRMYKLGRLEGDRIVLEGTDYSGGVMSPCVAKGRVFYIGRFSEGDKVCRYPADWAASQGSSMAYTLESFDPMGKKAESDGLIAAAGATTKIEGYNPLSYANPFSCWLPFVDLSAADRSFRPFGMFTFEDPLNTNIFQLTEGYDTSYPFADTTIAWESLALPVQLSGSLGDNLIYGTIGAPERQSSASLSATLSLPGFPSPQGVAFGLGGSVLDRADGESGSPYGWGYSAWDGAVSAALGLYGRVYGTAKSTSRGLDLISYHDVEIAGLAYKTETHIIAAYDTVPLRLDVWGAWANKPILRLDATSEVFSSDRRPAYAEYAALDTSSSDLLVEGTLAYRLADQAIHTNLLDVYFNRLLVDVGCRGSYTQAAMHSSSFARVSLDVGAAQGMLLATPRLFGECFVRTDSSLGENQRFGFQFGFQTSTDAGTSMRSPQSLATMENGS